MAERQRYSYQGQEYDLSAELSQQEALERIKRHLSENAETTTVAEPEPDVEPSGATGFEETAFDVRQATNQPITISNVVSNLFDTENFIKTQAEVAQANKEAQESVGKITTTAAFETAASVPKIAYNIGTMVTPETMNAIKQEVSDFGPTAAVQNFIERIDPKQYLNQDEKIAAELATYLTFGGLGAKLTKKGTDLLVKKFGKKKSDEIINKGILPKLGKNIKEQAPYTIGAITGVTQAAVQLQPDENTFAELINKAPELRAKLEEAKENPEDSGMIESFVLKLGSYIDRNAPQELKNIARALEINPDDTEAQILKKRYIEEFAGNVILGLPIDAVILALRTGGQSLKSVVSKLVSSKAPTTGPNTTLVSSEVVERPSGEVVTNNTYSRKTSGLISSLVDATGKFNTALARRFFSQAGLPKRFAKLAEDRINQIGAAEGEVNSLIKDIKKAQKDFNVSDEQFKNWISGTDEGVLRTLKVKRDNFESLTTITAGDELPEGFTKVADGARKEIQKNNDRINDLLNLQGDKRINVVVDGEEVYYRRMFEASQNKKYYRETKDGLERVEQARISGAKLPDDEVAIKIINARDYFRKLGVPEDELDLAVRTAVQRLSQGRGGDNGSLSSLIFGDVGAQSGGAGKVLKGRKLDVEDDAPLLALLGEKTEPLIKFEATLSAQQKLIAELDFIRGVARAAEETAGDIIPMQKLIPLLPGAKTQLLDKGQIKGAALRSVDYNLLEDFVQPRIGRFGGSETELLKDVFTTPQFGKYLDLGLDLAGPIGNNPGTLGILYNGMRRGAALAQSKETILDVPAYGLNTVGAATNTIFNGTAFNGAVLNEAKKSLEVLIKGLATNDKAAVNKLAFYKRKGIVNQDIAGRALRENALLYRGRPDTVYKTLMKGAGGLYGAPDSAAKILGYETRLTQLKKVYPYDPKRSNASPKQHDEMLEDMAAEFIKDTVPTYTIAMPFAKSVSKTPLFGNYVLFTTETGRTYKNIAKEALKETAIAAKRLAAGEKGAGQHVLMATKQLAGASTMVAGGYEAIDYFNDGGSIFGFRLVEPSYDMEVVDSEAGRKKTVQAKLNVPANAKLMSITAPDWGKGTKPMFSKPFMLDETAGERLTKEQKEYWIPRGGFVPQIQGEVVNSNTMIYTDYINSAFKLLLGKALGGSDEIDSTVLDKAEQSATQLVTGTFTSPKFLLQGVLNAYMGVDANGKPLYDKLPGETIQDKFVAGVDTLYKNVIEGGTIKAIKNIAATSSAEELMAAGQAERMSGFPMTFDSVIKSLSGQRFLPVRPLTAAGYIISQDVRELEKSGSAYREFLNKGLGGAPSKRTEEDVQKVVDYYKDMQERKFKVTNSMARKIDTFEDVRYIRRYRDPKTKKVKEELKELGFIGVINAATRQFKNDPKDEVLTALIANSKSTISNGFFIPDDPVKFIDTFGKEALSKQGFTTEQVVDIIKEQNKIRLDYITNRKIFEKDQEG